MSKFSLALLVAVSVTLMEDVGAMKGGQILEQPLPYTVYILTGDPDDVLHMRKKGTKYKVQEEVKPGVNLSAIEEYRVDEENSSAPGNGGGSNQGGESSTLNSKAAGTTEADKVPAEKSTAGSENNDGNITLDQREMYIEEGAETNSEKSNKKGGTGHGTVDYENAGQSLGKQTAPEVNVVGLDGSKGLPELPLPAKKFVLAPASSSKAAQNRDRATREEQFSDSIANKLVLENGTTPKESNAAAGKEKVVPDGDEIEPAPTETVSKFIKEKTLASGEDGLAPGGDGTPPDKTALKDRNPSPSIADISSESEISASGDSTTTREPSGKSTSSKVIPAQSSSGSYVPQNFNSTKTPPPHCRLAASTARPNTTTLKPPRPKKLWRVCMGVIFGNQTILTGDICFARAEGLHFFVSVNAKSHDEAQVVTEIVDGRAHFDFRVIRLHENQTLPGDIPEWQDKDTNIEEMSNSSRTGIVPSFGYPPMVAALQLLPLDKCRKIYDELLDAFPSQTVTLPAFLADTVVCATQADKPIDFPDGVGLVQPGLACPDSLGAPFVLSDGTVLGVLVAADCRDKNVAFFQTLGKGIPTVDEEEDEYTDH